MSDNFLSYRETIEVVQEFLETAIHTVLYLRQVYPQELFAKRKKYNSVLVWQCRHPALNEYLGRAIEAVGEELAKGSLSKVGLVIKKAGLDDTPLERFVWDFDWLVPPKDTAAARDRDWTPKTGGITHAEVEDYLRGFLLKLTVADSYLVPLPPDITFGIVIELNDDADPPESALARKGYTPSEWIPAEERHTSRMGGPADMDMDGGDERKTVAPLKTTRLGIISVQMLVEEFEGKEASQDTPLAASKGKGKAAVQ